MRAHDQNRFFALWDVVLEANGKTLSEEALWFYWRALENYEIEQIEQAMMAHTRDPSKGGFAPKPSDIVRHIEGDPEQAADRAWGRVLRALERVGSWSNVVFDDRAIHAVIHDMGGWARLCSTQKRDLPYRAQEFRRLYQGYRRGGVRHHPAILYGTATVREDAPVMLGDQEACQAVYREGSKGRKPLRKLEPGGQLQKLRVLNGAEASR